MTQAKNNVSQPPLMTPIIERNGRLNSAWSNWFRDLYRRTAYKGGNAIDDLVDNLDKLTIRVTKNEEDINALDIRVTTNEEDINSLDIRVTKNEEDIQAITIRVTKNEEDILELQEEQIQNRKVVNEFSDFPDALDSDKEYYIGGDILFPDTLPATFNNIPKRVRFTGNAVSSKLTYNGTGTFLKGVDVGQFISSGVLISAPDAKVFDFSDVSGNSIINILTTTVIDCAQFGTFNCFALITDLSNIVDAGQGLGLTGTKTKVLSINKTTINSTSATFTMIDLGSSELSTLELRDLRSNAPIGAVALKGLANSANIAVGQVGDIVSCELSGGIASLSGIVDDDSGFGFTKVTGVINSKAIGHCYVTTVETTAVTIGVDVPVEGVYAQGSETSQATTSADGIITMNNRIETRGTVTVDLQVEKNGGGEDTYLFKVIKIPIATGIAVDVDGGFSNAIFKGAGTEGISFNAPARYVKGDQFLVTVQGVAGGDDIEVQTQGFLIE